MPDLAASRGWRRLRLGIWNFVFFLDGQAFNVHYHVAPFCWCIRYLILDKYAVGNVMYMTCTRTPSGSS